MIRYALTCSDGHRFESWFQSADAFDALAGKGLVTCAQCGGTDVRKAMMAPRVTVKDTPPDASPSTAPDALSGAASAPPKERPLAPSGTPAEAMLRAMREHIAKNSTYVGGKFAREARAMHLGESDNKSIHGEASPEEARALIEDGIPIAPLPFLPPDKVN